MRRFARAATHGDGDFAMTGRTSCASAQWLARFCALGLGGALLALAAKPQAATFTYTNPSCTSFTVSGSPPTQTVTCVTSGGGGGGAAPTCSPSASPSAQVAVGTSVTVSANCDSQPTSYQWTGGACAGKGATCVVQKGRAGTVLFTVSGTNGSG